MVKNNKGLYGSLRAIRSTTYLPWFIHVQWLIRKKQFYAAINLVLPEMTTKAFYVYYFVS